MVHGSSPTGCAPDIHNECNKASPSDPLQGQAPDDAFDGVGQDLTKSSRSALIVSASVVGMPCGNPS